MVWIVTGSASDAEFNALKENTLMVYPISAKQYINGVWVDKTMQIYTDGAWSEPTSKRYLYNIGDQNEAFTGGLEVFLSANMEVQFNDANIYCHAVDGSSDSSANIRAKNKIDITNFSTLSIDAEYVSNTGFTFGISNGSTTKYVDFVASEQTSGQDGIGRRTVSLDISSLAGEYYASFTCANSGTLFAMWLE